MAIKLCPAHLREMEDKWGSREKIAEAYDGLLVDADHCEDLRCIRKTLFYCPHCGKSVKANELVEI